MKLILLFILNLSLSFAGDNDMILVDDPQSNAWKNTTEVASFLEKIGERQKAQALLKILTTHNLYHQPIMDYWFIGSLRGLTNGINNNITIRYDVMNPHRYLSLNDNTNGNDLSLATVYFAIATHEIIHSMDVGSGLPYPGVSPENETYDRAFRVYLKALKYFLDQYEVSTDRDEKNLWVMKAQKMANMIHEEMSTYPVESYEEITNPFYPFDYHQQCIRNLPRAEMAQYALIAGQTLYVDEDFSDFKTRFDKVARFHFSDKSPECLNVARLTLPPQQQMPAGERGAFLRQKVIGLPTLPEGHSLRIRKKGPKADQVAITFYRIEDDSVVPHLLSYQTYMSASEIDRTISAGYVKGRMIAIVSEISEGQFPTAEEMSLLLTHTWSHDGQNYESPVNNTTLYSDYQQQQLGYYYPQKINQEILLTKDSPSDPNYSGTQLGGIKLTVPENLTYKFHLPTVDNRNATLYKVVGQELKLELYMGAEDTSRKISLEEAGDYVLFVTRPPNKLTPQKFEIQIEVATNRQRAPFQDQVKITAMSESDFAQLGYYPPLYQQKDFSFKMQTSPVGFDAKYFGQTLNPFRAFALVELQTKKDDFVSLELSSNGIYYLLEKLDGDQFEFITMANSNLSGMYINHRVLSDRTHYLLIQDTGRAFPELEFGSIRYVHHSKNDPPRPLRILSIDETMKLTGLSTPVIKRVENEILTALHPRGLIIANSPYQLYQFDLKDNARIKFFHSRLGMNHRTVLYKLDLTRFAENLPSLEEVDYIQDSDYSIHSQDLSPGHYYLAIEAAEDALGETPFQLSFARGGVLLENELHFRRLTVGEMRDPRLQEKR